MAASHMIMRGLVDEGLAIVRAARDRHDGSQPQPVERHRMRLLLCPLDVRLAAGQRLLRPPGRLRRRPPRLRPEAERRLPPLLVRRHRLRPFWPQAGPLSPSRSSAARFRPVEVASRATPRNSSTARSPPAPASGSSDARARTPAPHLPRPGPLRRSRRRAMPKRACGRWGQGRRSRGRWRPFTLDPARRGLRHRGATAAPAKRPGGLFAGGSRAPLSCRRPPASRKGSGRGAGGRAGRRGRCPARDEPAPPLRLRAASPAT